jgi:hypothetical protein
MLLHRRPREGFAETQTPDQLEAVPQLGIATVGADEAKLGQGIDIRMSKVPKNAEEG